MKQLANNKELYDYLVVLAAKLRVGGAESLADMVFTASKQAAGLSADFLGESRIALRKLSDSDEVVLSDADREDLADVLRQLSSALDRRHPPKYLRACTSRGREGEPAARVRGGLRWRGPRPAISGRLALRAGESSAGRHCLAALGGR